MKVILKNLKLKFPRNFKSSQGFTLLEVLAAVAILGISLVTIIGLQINTIRLQKVANRTTVATLLAQEKMNELLTEISREESPSLYFDEGDFEEGFEIYHWEYTLATTPADTLYRIDLLVYWDPEDKESNSITLNTFVAVEES